jgi:hypothetical protein
MLPGKLWVPRLEGGMDVRHIKGDQLPRILKTCDAVPPPSRSFSAGIENPEHLLLYRAFRCRAREQFVQSAPGGTERIVWGGIVLVGVLEGAMCGSLLDASEKAVFRLLEN